MVGSILGSAYGQGLKINEIMASKSSVIADEDGEYPDWIELKNGSTSSVELDGLFLSDKKENLKQWPLPSGPLQSNAHLLIFASDKDRRNLPLRAHTIVDIGDSWAYQVPTNEIENWRDAAFDDSSWQVGESGFGFGDNDDETELAQGTTVVYLRKTFQLSDVAFLGKFWLHIDYDDSFVAYLNGKEIARELIGKTGVLDAYDALASDQREAIWHSGQPLAEYEFIVKDGDFVNGQNVLAIEVHNISNSSSDMSAIPVFTVASSVAIADPNVVSQHINITEGGPHTNFKLSSGGETVYLSNTEGVIIDSLAYPSLPSDVSYGRNSLQELVYFATATPGSENSERTSVNGIVEESVAFSIEDFILSSTTSLELSGAKANQVIHYTLDGTSPTEASDSYSEPINISKNTNIRAIIYQDGYLPSKEYSKTYLFGVSHDLPIVSIVTDPDNLWDEQTGIYVLGDEYENEPPYNGANFWEDWEKPAHIEMVDVDGTQMFSKNCGIKIFGGYSRSHDQRSLAIHFRKSYGEEPLEYPLFEGLKVDKFHSLVLRNAGNDWGKSMIRDLVWTELVADTDNDRAANRQTVVYINGEYWGLMNLREKINEDFLAAHHKGVKADSIDLLEVVVVNPILKVSEGSDALYYDMLSYMEDNAKNTEAFYTEMDTRMDISNFIDYQVSQIYFGNRDWPGNNSKYWRPQTENGKWRWILFDTEFSFNIYGTDEYKHNTLDAASTPNGNYWPNPHWSTYVLRTMLENPRFKSEFIGRFADLLNTTFVPDTVIALIDKRANAIESEIQEHYYRWTPWQTTAIWKTDLNNMKNFAKLRPQNVRQHISSKFGKSQQTVQITQDLKKGKMSINHLKIPNATWSGIYFKDSEIVLDAEAKDGYELDHWDINGETFSDLTISITVSGNTTIKPIFRQAGIENANPTIKVNEINYQSGGEGGSGDWIELVNLQPTDQDLSGWELKDSQDDHVFIFPAGTTIGASGYLVIAENVELFQKVHANVTTVIGGFDFGFGKTDSVRLYDQSRNLEDIVAYANGGDWPKEDAEDYSLSLLTSELDNNVPSHWLLSSTPLGTPGAINFEEDEKVMASDDFYGLEIYPNPVSDLLTIKLPDGQWHIQLLSLSGSIVKEEKLASGELHWSFNQGTSSSMNGIYLLQLRNLNRTIVRKLVVR